MIAHVPNGRLALVGICVALVGGCSSPPLVPYSLDMPPLILGFSFIAGAAGGALVASFAGNLLDFFDKQGNIQVGYTILFLIAGSAYVLAWTIMKLMSPKMKKVEDLI